MLQWQKVIDGIYVLKSKRFIACMKRHGAGYSTRYYTLTVRKPDETAEKKIGEFILEHNGRSINGNSLGNHNWFIPYGTTGDWMTEEIKMAAIKILQELDYF